jgi:hypothetical protein
MMGSMGRLYIVLFFAQIALAAVALISCLSAEEGDLRALPRWAWVLIILFFPLLGSIGYFAAGRPVRPGRARTRWPAGGGFAEPIRPRAPDDDPEFLRSLERETKAAEDQELLRRWEEDLKRREDELRRPDPDTEG